MLVRCRNASVVALCLLALCAAGSAAVAQTPGPDTGGLTLEVVMAHPDWLGRAPESAYWADDGESAYFERKREGEELSDLYEVDLQGNVHRVADDERGTISVPDGDWSRDRTRKVYTRAGDVYLRDLGTGSVRQLTRTSETESQARFMADESRVAFRRGDAIFVRDLVSGLEWQPAEILAEKDPAEAEREEEEGEEYLARQQEDLFEIVRRREERERARREREMEERRDDPSRTPPPFYLGDDVRISGGSLSPSGDWMVVSTAPKNAEPGRRDLMPEYVTETGYVETEEVRPKVGTGDGVGERLWLLDLRRHEVHELDLAVLPGIDDDPLAALREAAEARREREREEAEAADEEDQEDQEEAAESVEEGVDEQAEEAEEERGEQEVLEGEDPVMEDVDEPEVATVDDEDDAEADGEDEEEEEELRAVQVGPVVWNEDGSRVAIQLFSVDNKDRWIATVDFEGAALEPFHRLHDEAWINWDFHAMDWLPDGETLWYLSEEDGFSHLYAARSGGEARRITRGEFVVDDPTLAPGGETFYFRGNREHPGIWEVYRVPADPADPATSIERVTHLDATVDYVLSPHGERLLLRHSTSIRPPELYVQEVPAPADAGMAESAEAEARRLTRTVSDEYLAFDWRPPEIVAIPSSHGAHRPIFSRLYLPEDHDPNRAEPYPAVMFVHGAGYTQDVFDGWSYYFREHMFHEMLTRLGYVVLEMDYRGSAGYGRDWRTAIYRRMGTPELEDFLDGIDWLADEQNVDPQRVGIYGGSYGGFMTMMALFKEPGEFAAGAALRPVTDWAHYNHPYTSNILNTPEVDPEAYERSSPIELAEGLEDPLLIIHGMLDDNVLFQDSVRLAQRLIELEKEDWWLVPYPIEPHAFQEPSSWLDAYRRIFDLMERHVRDVE